MNNSNGARSGGDMRAQFEAWATGAGISLRRNASVSDWYDHKPTVRAWRAWRAAIAARQPVGVDTYDIMAMIVRGCCESEPADPDHAETICISVADLEAIVASHLGVLILDDDSIAAPPAPAAVPVDVPVPKGTVLVQKKDLAQLVYSDGTYPAAYQIAAKRLQALLNYTSYEQIYE
ncbi:hypothetical protein [Xanthomonas phage DES1]|nr:hypothetical protein [Xanthomonas phage DES1]